MRRLMVVAAFVSVFVSGATPPHIEAHAALPRPPVQSVVVEKEYIPHPHFFVYQKPVMHKKAVKKHVVVWQQPKRHNISLVKVAIKPGFMNWLASPATKKIRNCESGVRTAVYGAYMGAWQMDESFWRSNGGLKYSATPLGATLTQQNIVAYNGYLSRGWEPWSCARILGYYP